MAWTGENARNVAAYGAAIGRAPALFYLLTGSPAAPMACDALSWSYVGPAASAGPGLRGSRLFYPSVESRRGSASVFAVGAASLAWFLGVSPRASPVPTDSFRRR